MTSKSNPEVPGGALQARTPQDYAIEHAEYMAQAGAHLLTAMTALHIAKEADDQSVESIDAVEAAYENVHEMQIGLHDAIYEFRKRRDRAALASQPAGQPKEVRMPGNVKPDTDKQVFFYEQDFYVLSNFSAFTLEWSGILFHTSEAAYHWCKFIDRDPEVQDMIIEAPSAHAAFKIAESQKAFRREDWDAVKVDFMRSILRAKAAQHEYVRRKLLQTGARELIEDSWRDDYWGWGPNRDGKNMLGKLWMEVRAELRAKETPHA